MMCLCSFTLQHLKTVDLEAVTHRRSHLAFWILQCFAVPSLKHRFMEFKGLLLQSWSFSHSCCVVNKTSF